MGGRGIRDPQTPPLYPNLLHPQRLPLIQEPKHLGGVRDSSSPPLHPPTPSLHPGQEPKHLRGVRDPTTRPPKFPPLPLPRCRRRSGDRQ